MPPVGRSARRCLAEDAVPRPSGVRAARCAVSRPPCGDGPLRQRTRSCPRSLATRASRTVGTQRGGPRQLKRPSHAGSVGPIRCRNHCMNESLERVPEATDRITASCSSTDALISKPFRTRNTSGTSSGQSAIEFRILRENSSSGFLEVVRWVTHSICHRSRGSLFRRNAQGFSALPKGFDLVIGQFDRQRHGETLAEIARWGEAEGNQGSATSQPPDVWRGRSELASCPCGTVPRSTELEPCFAVVARGAFQWPLWPDLSEILGMRNLGRGWLPEERHHGFKYRSA